MATQKQIRAALNGLEDWQKPVAYLRGTEHYDVSAQGETKKDWIAEAARFDEDMYLVSINLGGYTGVTVAVMAGHPDTALQTADEWTCTKYYGGDYDECEEARARGEGVIYVKPLMETVEQNPTRLVDASWTPVGTFGDFPTWGGIVYRDNGGYAMIYAREGESRDDIWVWRVEDATDKGAIVDYDLDEVARVTGYPLEELQRAAKSDDPISLAQVWDAIAMAYGGLDVFGDPEWEGTYDEVWNEYADDYNRANQPQRQGNVHPATAGVVAGMVGFVGGAVVGHKLALPDVEATLDEVQVLIHDGKDREASDLLIEAMDKVDSVQTQLGGAPTELRKRMVRLNRQLSPRNQIFVLQEGRTDNPSDTRKLRAKLLR